MSDFLRTIASDNGARVKDRQMLRSILVALDASPHSEPAIELAIQWAKEQNARLTGIGVIDQPMHKAKPAAPCEESVPKMQGHWKDAADQVELYVEQFSRSCRESELSANTLKEVGVPSERIVLEAKRHDLIVMSHEFETPESAGDTFTLVLQTLLGLLWRFPGRSQQQTASSSHTMAVFNPREPCRCSSLLGSTSPTLRMSSV